MPLLVIVDPLAFSRGWLGSAQRYFQVAKALRELDWDVAVVARRDKGRAAREVDAAFPGQVVRTPFGTVPALLSPWGLRHAWWLARLWTGRASGEDVWAAHLARWTDRFKLHGPLASADLLCAVTYHYWGTPEAVRSMAQELEVPYWLDIQDPLVGTIGSGQPRLSEDQLLCLHQARQIVTTTDTYTEHLRETLPESAGKIECLRLTQNLSAAIATDAAPPDGRLVLLHAGYLNGQPNRSAIPVLDAMARLYKEDPSARGKVTLRLVGEGHGIREAIARANKLGLRRDLECLPQVSPKALQRQLDTADVLCILKAAVTRRDFQIPGKTYDYLFSNKPILAVTFPGELAGILEETGSGFAVAPDDIGRLADILERLLQQKTAAGSVALERNMEKLSPYTFDAFRQKLETVLAACTSVGGRGALEQTHAGEKEHAPGLRLIYFAPADMQVARVDRNCIIKFCEAMAEDHASVTLVCLRVRVLESEPTATRTIWDVFGVRRKFDLVSVPSGLRQQQTDARLGSVVLRTARAVAYPLVAARLLLHGRPSSEVAVAYVKNLGLVPGLRLARRLGRRRTLILFEAHVPPCNRFQQWALKSVDGIVCNGYAVRKVLLDRALAQPDRSIAVHQGFNLEAYPAGDQEELRKDARRRLGWGEHDSVAVYTGKVYWPYEEVDLLVRTAAKLAPEGVRLVIVGGRADQVELWREETARRDISNVSFTGFVAPSEIVDYQIGADVLLSYYPSGIELNDYRSPGKLFEYMASGTPIVAADYASLREVLEDGRNAILIEPGKPELLAQAISRLVNDPALGDRLGSQARADATRYTWAARAEAISTFVSSLENT